MSEAVAILFLEVIKLSLQLTILVVEGQPADLRKKAWERHDRDIERIRKFLKLDDAPPPPTVTREIRRVRPKMIAVRKGRK